MKKFTTDKPIYLQLVDIFKHEIIRGKWKEGQKIPSVRVLAVLYGVNPNTVQRALSELEHQHLLRAERTAGRFVCKNNAVIDSLKNDAIDDAVKKYIASMQGLSQSRERSVDYVIRYWREND